jgi:hypothetical protein
MHVVYAINQFMYPESDTFGPDHERLRRLQYVTKNFNDLQGLMTAALGIEFLAFRISDLHINSWLSFLMSVFGIVVGFIALRRLPEYYERRFGQVEPKSKPKPMTRGEAIGCLGFIVGILVFSIFGGPLGTAINYHLNAMFAVPDHRLNFLPILFWLVGLALNIPSRHDRLIDLRRTFLFPGGTLVWGAVMLLPFYNSELANLTWWKLLDDGWLSISLVMIGLYNHFMLVWLLPRKSEVEQ